MKTFKTGRLSSILQHIRIELEWNEIFGDWWIDIGVCICRTEYHPNYNWLFSISLLLFTVYIRGGKKPSPEKSTIITGKNS